MHIAPDNTIVSCAIALLLGGWSFGICYLLFSKARIVFYVLCAGIIAFDLFLFFAYVGILVITVCAIVGIFASIAHGTLDIKVGGEPDGCFNFFWVHYVASQLPAFFILVLLGVSFSNNYVEPVVTNPYSIVLLVIGPSFSLVPLYMFKTYCPRLGIDTHFPDTGNN